MTDPAQPPQSGWWESNRVEAFSDGVMAVIITIMAFDLKRPDHGTWSALSHSLSSLLVYILSFMVIGIYWNNHHHLFRATERISGAVMWANLFLLFWLSLLPFVTDWVSRFYKDHLPASVYGMVALGAAVAYGILVRTIIRVNGRDSAVGVAVGSDLKGNVSVTLYAAGVGLAWVSPWIAYGLYLAVAVVWFVPDRRFARARRDPLDPARGDSRPL
jgi:uncharacterized membrane protein